MQAYGFELSSGPGIKAFWPVKDVSGAAVKRLSPYELCREHQTFCRLSRKQKTIQRKLPDGTLLLIEGDTCGSEMYSAGPRTWRAIKVGDTLTAYDYTPLYRRGQLLRWRFYYHQHACQDNAAGNKQMFSREIVKDYSVNDRPDPYTIDLVALGNTMNLGSFVPNSWPIGSVAYEYDSPSYGDFYPDAGIIQTEFAHNALFGCFYDNNITRWTQEAYTRAAMQLPKVDSNAMANALELIALCKSVLRGDVTGALASGKKVGDMADAWLSYRYAYSTTMLDVEAYSKYFERIQQLSSDLANRTITSHGMYMHNGWTYRCAITVKVQDILPSKLSSAIEGLGCKLSAMNAWDMVPYSFVVDWFLPIGDVIEAFENKLEAMELKPVECWFSVASPGGVHYLRTPGSWQQALPVFDTHEVSDKTKWFRIADAVSLLK